MINEVKPLEFKNYVSKKVSHSDYSNGGWYLIERKCDGKKYIGKSIEVLHRLRQHTSQSNPKTDIDTSILELGVDSFRYYVIDTYKNYGIDFFNKELETVIENELIRVYKTFAPHGLNKTYYERI